MKPWPKHADGTDKLYAELSVLDRRYVTLGMVLQRAWNERRALWAEQCLKLALKLMPKNTQASQALDDAVLQYCAKRNKSANP